MPSAALRRAVVVQALSSGGLSVAGLFIPTLAQDLGASDLQIGAIGAAYGAALFASAWVFGRLADMGRRRRLIQAGMAACFLAAPLHLMASDAATLAAARALFGFAAGIYPAALISYAYDAQRRPGRFAGWGSLGSGVGTFLAGLLGPGSLVFVAASLALGLALLVALRLESRPEVRVRVSWLPREVIRANAPAYLALLTRHVGAAAVWVVYPLYLASLGASPFDIGILYFLNTGAQFLFMGLLDRFAPRPLVAAGLLSSALVFVLLRATPDWVFVVPVQLVLALSWALLYVGALAWVMEHNVERATSTGLLQSSISLANVVGPLLGGLVVAWGGFPAVLSFGAVLSVLALPLFLASARRVERAGRSARDVVVLQAQDAEA